MDDDAGTDDDVDENVVRGAGADEAGADDDVDENVASENVARNNVVKDVVNNDDKKMELWRLKQTHVPSCKITVSASLATAPTPQSYQQAVNSVDHVHWQNAMLYEYDKIMEHKVAMVVDSVRSRPQGQD